MSHFRLSNDPRPTTLPDIFVRDVPLRVHSRIADAAAAAEASPDTLGPLCLLLFEEVIVDGDGQPFENVRSVEDVAQMGIARLTETTNAVLEAISPEKPSGTTARSPRKSTSSSKGSARKR